MGTNAGLKICICTCKPWLHGINLTCKSDQLQEAICYIVCANGGDEFISMTLMPHTLQSHLLHYNRLQSTSRHDWRMMCAAVLLSDKVMRVHAQE